MSDDTSKQIVSLTLTMERYIAKNDQILDEIRRLVKAHSDEIWGTGDDNPGMKSKVSTIIQERETEHEEFLTTKKNEREEKLWWRTAIGVPVLGLIIQALWNFFHK
jgi:hypothetical protein